MGLKMDDRDWATAHVIDQVCDYDDDWAKTVKGMDEHTRSIVNEMADMILATGIRVSYISGFTRGAKVGAIVSAIIAILFTLLVIKW